LYHTIVSPLLITWYMFPMYLYMTGYTVLDIGVLYTIVHIASIIATYLIGKLFDRIAIRHGLVLIDGLEGFSCILMGLAYGPFAPILLFIALLLDDIASIFYPLYQATEKILYPSDRLEEVFAWHMRLPEISQLIGFLVLGFLFGYIYTTPYHYRLGFVLFGLVSILLIVYLLKALPRLDRVERLEIESFEFRVDREFIFILLIEALVMFAWSLAPEIVLLNYIVNVLGYTLFEVMVVEAFISLGAITATYVSEKISSKHRFKVLSIGYFLVSLWALIMYFKPPLTIVLLAYFISRFGDTLAFPFHRSWIFSKIPADRASSLLATISSYRRIITFISPAIAGYLAYLYPTLPYLASLILFVLTSLLLLIYSKISSRS